MPDINTTYKHIRLLVGRYYNGETSPAEEAELFDFFAGTDPTTLPVDLRDEADVFCALGAGATPPPADILAEIDRQILVEAVAPRRRNGFSRYIWAAAAVAVGVVIGVSSLKTVTLDTGDIEPLQPRVATVTTPADDEPAVVTPDEPIEQPAERPAVQSRSKGKGLRGKKSTLADEGYRELTDPNEAAEVLLHIDRMMSSTLVALNTTEHRVAAEVGQVDEILTNTINQVNEANKL